MPQARPPLPYVVLAGERPGGNALARALGIPAGVLADVAGETALSRVLGVLRSSPGLKGGVLCGPVADVVAASGEMQRLPQVVCDLPHLDMLHAARRVWRSSEVETPPSTVPEPRSASVVRSA